MRRGEAEAGGFTFAEMMVVVADVAVLAVLMLSALAKAGKPRQKIICTSKLIQISLGFKQWLFDNTNAFPMNLSTNLGGTKEWIAAGETFRHFAVLSNELNWPSVLVCPADAGRRQARSFDSTLSNSNLSYFIGIEARADQPQMIFLGDRNIWSGIRPANGVVALTTNNFTGWGPGLLGGQGNVVLSDESVQSFSSSRLREALGNSGDGTNWVQLP